MSDHHIDLDALAHSRNGHSVFAPSGSKMWLTCSGSLIPNLLAHDTAGEDAAEGTVAHGVAETWLKTGKKPRHLIGTQEWVDAGDWGFMINIDEVMLEYVQQYVDWCAFLPGEHFVEQKVYFSELTPLPNQGGTADHVACEPGRMVITDLKYGKGVPVYAENNTQGRLYALGFFFKWDHKYHFEEIVIRIAQPRLDLFTEWTITRKQLLEFAEYVKVRAREAWQINAPRTPSPEGCQWCKVKADCAAYAKVLSDLTEGLFDDLLLDGPTPVTEQQVVDYKDKLALTAIPAATDVMRLSTAELALLYGWRGFADSWWKAMADELFRRAAQGEKIPGWKMVEGRSRRVFRFPTDAGKSLVRAGVPENQVFVTQVCSPAEAEKLLRKVGYKTAELPELLDGLVYRPPGKPTLARVADKRPELVNVSESAFADLIENPETCE